jgi:hypothetical protein
VLGGASPEVTWLAGGTRGAEDTAAPTADVGAGAGGTVVEAAGECGAEVTAGRDSPSAAATTDVAGTTDEGPPVEMTAGVDAGTICSAFEAPRSGEGSGARCSD